MGFFDWLFGRHSDSDPAQAHLDELLARVTRIRALLMPTTAPFAVCPIPGRVRPFPGSQMESKPDIDMPEVLLDMADPEAVRAFQKTLHIVERSWTFGRCSCLGCPTLELYSAEELLATIGVQHGQAIRWDRWNCAAELSDDQALTNWLITYGVEPGLADVLIHTAMMPFAPGIGPSGKCRYRRG